MPDCTRQMHIKTHSRVDLDTATHIEDHRRKKEGIPTTSSCCEIQHYI